MSKLAQLVRTRCTWTESTTLLDFGCGTHGNIATELCYLAVRTVGVDINEEAVNLFNEKCDKQDLDPSEVCAIHTPSFFASTQWLNYFDICVASLVFHHLKDTLETSKALIERLRPGGKLIIIDLLKQQGINGFTSETLSDTLTQAGFEDINIETGPPIRLRRTQKPTRLLIAQGRKPMD